MVQYLITEVGITSFCYYDFLIPAPFLFFPPFKINPMINSSLKIVLKLDAEFAWEFLTESLRMLSQLYNSFSSAVPSPSSHPPPLQKKQNHHRRKNNT